MRLPPGGGVLPLDKPPGPTSHDVVVRARRALKEKRIGHTGTLDPFADGLLLLCLGPATRLSQYLTRLNKEYTASAHLGVTTDTDDVEGEIVAEGDISGVTESDVCQALKGLVGKQMQVPPVYSAKKIDGVAAHRRARRGETITPEGVPIEVYDIELLSWHTPMARFHVVCSTGTYIRALARDLGRSLAVGAHLKSLRRTRVGSIGVENAISLDGLEDPDAIADVLLDPLLALSHMTSVVITPEEAARLANGRWIEGRESVTGSEPLLLVCDGRLIAVGSAQDGRLHPRKVFQ